MSRVTSIILTFSVLENDEQKRVNEVNMYQISPTSFVDLKSIEDSELDEVWYGGSKYLNGSIYMGAYDDINVKDFLHHVFENVFWEEPEEVILFIHDELSNDKTYKCYSQDNYNL